jgi:hypothetical protein
VVTALAATAKSRNRAETLAIPAFPARAKIPQLLTIATGRFWRNPSVPGSAAKVELTRSRLVLGMVAPGATVAFRH